MVVVVWQVMHVRSRIGERRENVDKAMQCAGICCCNVGIAAATLRSGTVMQWWCSDFFFCVVFAVTRVLNDAYDLHNSVICHLCSFHCTCFLFPVIRLVVIIIT